MGSGNGTAGWMDLETANMGDVESRDEKIPFFLVVIYIGKIRLF